MAYLWVLIQIAFNPLDFFSRTCQARSQDLSLGKDKVYASRGEALGTGTPILGWRSMHA
jgi:hypothetical protein